MISSGGNGFTGSYSSILKELYGEFNLEHHYMETTPGSKKELLRRIRELPAAELAILGIELDKDNE